MGQAAEAGIVPERDVWTAARRVVWAWYYDGDDTWAQLTEAIENLEKIVGQPKNFEDI